MTGAASSWWEQGATGVAVVSVKTAGAIILALHCHRACVPSLPPDQSNGALAAALPLQVYEATKGGIVA